MTVGLVLSLQVLLRLWLQCYQPPERWEYWAMAIVLLATGTMRVVAMAYVLPTTRTTRGLTAGLGLQGSQTARTAQ
eukprot:2301356-Rhodomonas_salina.2